MFYYFFSCQKCYTFCHSTGGGCHWLGLAQRQTLEQICFRRLSTIARFLILKSCRSCFSSSVSGASCSLLVVLLPSVLLPLFAFKAARTLFLGCETVGGVCRTLGEMMYVNLHACYSPDATHYLDFYYSSIACHGYGV